MQHVDQVNNAKFKKVGLAVLGVYLVLFGGFALNTAHAHITAKNEVTSAQYQDIFSKLESIKDKPYAGEFRAVVNGALNDGALQKKEYQRLDGYFSALIKHEMMNKG